jgi:hypothetical protein
MYSSFKLSITSKNYKNVAIHLYVYSIWYINDVHKQLYENEFKSNSITVVASILHEYNKTV